MIAFPMEVTRSETFVIVPGFISACGGVVVIGPSHVPVIVFVTSNDFCASDCAKTNEVSNNSPKNPKRINFILYSPIRQYISAQTIGPALPDPQFAHCYSYI